MRPRHHLCIIVIVIIIIAIIVNIDLSFLLISSFDASPPKGYVEVRDRYFWPSNLGIGLVDGYDAMDLNFVTPQLRALMERDMNAIAAGQVSASSRVSFHCCSRRTFICLIPILSHGLGQKTREEVLRNCLQAMKQTYLEVVSKAPMLDRHLASHYTPVNQEYDLTISSQRV